MSVRTECLRQKNGEEMARVPVIRHYTQRLRESLPGREETS
jgi:hypothetical protein